MVTKLLCGDKTSCSLGSPASAPKSGHHVKDIALQQSAAKSHAGSSHCHSAFMNTMYAIQVVVATTLANMPGALAFNQVMF